MNRIPDVLEARIKSIADYLRGEGQHIPPEDVAERVQREQEKLKNYGYSTRKQEKLIKILREVRGETNKAVIVEV